MSKNHDQHSHGDKGHHPKNHGSAKRGLHKDWRTWFVVAVMVGLVFAYLVTMDEQISPVNNPQPAATPAQ